MRALRPVVEGLAFLCELWLLVVLGMAGWDLVDATGPRIALAAALPLVAAGVWGVWMAPQSGRRLPDPARFVAQVALFVAAGALAAVAGHPVLGVAFPLVATAVFALTRLTGGVTGSPSAPPRSVE